jgi:hypothetical protein
VGEYEHRTVLDAEGLERAADLIALTDPGHVVNGIRLIGRIERDLDAPPRLANVISASMNEEPVKPGFEPIPVAKAANVAPGADERVLDRVVGSISVAQDPYRDRVEAMIGGARERIERLVVALLCSRDEFGRHADLSK